MKLDEILKPEERVVIEKQLEQKKELKFIGSMKRNRGQTLFSFNVKTGELKRAVIEQRVAIDFKTGLPRYTNKVMMEAHCIYIQALNEKNACKHIKRIVEQYKEQGQ